MGYWIKRSTHDYPQLYYAYHNSANIYKVIMRKTLKILWVLPSQMGDQALNWAGNRQWWPNLFPGAHGLIDSFPLITQAVERMNARSYGKVDMR